MQGNENQSADLNMADAYMKEYGKSVVYSQMTEDQTRLFLTITTGANDAELKKELGEFMVNCQSCLIMKTRFKLMGVDAEDSLLIMLSSFIDRPGLAVIAVIDVLNTINGRLVATFDDFVQTYPMGYYNVKDEPMMREIVNMCKDRKVNNSEIY